MFDDKDELQEFLDDDDIKTRKNTNKFYTNTRPLDSMGEELVNKVSSLRFRQPETSDEDDPYADDLSPILMKLTKKQQLVFLYKLCGFKQNQIARNMKISEMAGSAHQGKAQKITREILKTAQTGKISPVCAVFGIYC